MKHWHLRPMVGVHFRQMHFWNLLMSVIKFSINTSMIKVISTVWQACWFTAQSPALLWSIQIHPPWTWSLRILMIPCPLRNEPHNFQHFGRITWNFLWWWLISYFLIHLFNIPPELDLHLLIFKKSNIF